MLYFYYIGEIKMIQKTKFRMTNLILLIVFLMIGNQSIAKAESSSELFRQCNDQIGLGVLAGNIEACKKFNFRHYVLPNLKKELDNIYKTPVVVLPIPFCDPRNCDPSPIDFTSLREQVLKGDPTPQPNKLNRFNSNSLSIADQLNKMSIFKISVINLLDQLDEEIFTLEKKI